ncbi:MAG TPA: hypothetical protein VGY77_11495, partial [Gemmataceae bacterium]|nr:hypothetical protein [Gemmataceae bacterium]
MKGIWLVCLALGAMIGPLSGVQADVVPLEAIVSLAAGAQVNPDPLQYDQSTFTQEFAIDEMADTGFASDDIENGFAETLTAIDAVWSDAGHGEVQFPQIGFQTDINEAGGSASVNGTAWSYTFQTGNETEIVLD